ncbi:MAG: dockerin type I domain-containing protein [Planctomycetota bacterium]
MNANREFSGSHRIWRCALAATALATTNSFAFDFGYEELVQTSDQMDIVVPGYSVPSFVRWDGDDLRDLVIGEGSGGETAKVRVYLNLGTQSEPEFSVYFYAQSNGKDLVVPGSGCLGVFPRVVYWDTDNRKDLLVGLSDGRAKIYLNIGTDEVPTFDEGTYLLAGQPGFKTEIDVGARATSSVVDWNEDEKKDLIIGALEGTVHVSINEGTDAQPDFRTEEHVQSSGEDLVVPLLRSSPVIRDIDGDGQLDILTGDTEGQLLLYLGPSFSEALAVEAAGVPIDLAGSARSRPLLCHWNNDERLDVLIGAGDGLIHLYPGVPVGDINFDGVVNVSDFLELLAHWGESGGPADVNNDGVVDVLDFLLVLANWTT